MKKAAILYLSLFLIFGFGTVAQNRQLDSLLQLLPTVEADTNAVQLYMDICRQYRSDGDLKAATEYHLKSIELSRNLNYLRGIYDASDLYALTLKRLGMYDSAIAVNSGALALALRQNDHYRAADEKLYIGVGYAFKGFYETALTYYIEALAYYEQTGRQYEMAEMYYQIQTVYSQIRRYDDAIRYGEKALALYGDTLSSDYGYALLNLSLCHVNLHPPQDEKALEYLQKALHIANLTGYELMEARIHNYIAQIYFRANQLSESETGYRKALAVFSEDSSPNDFCIANIGMARLAIVRNDFEQAEARGMKNLELSRRYGLRLRERDALSFLWELFAARRDYAVQKHYKTAVDSIEQLILSETALRTIDELNIKFETEKKEMRITSLEEEKRLMTWLFIAGGGLLLLGLIVLIFLWRWTIQKRRLAEQQKQLAEQQVRQLEQEKQLVATQAVFDGEVQERSRLARDLHDGLGGKLTCMKINLQELNQSAGFDDDRESQLNAIMDLLDDTVREMRRVSHNLMPETLSRAGLKTAVGDFCRSMSPKIVFNWYGDETRLDMKFETAIYRCIHELVNNALKYAGATQIMVQIIREADCISFTVHDDGCGFDTAVATEGMGLQSIRTRVVSLGGEMQIDSTVGEGTEINVELGIK